MRQLSKTNDVNEMKTEDLKMLSVQCE